MGRSGDQKSGLESVAMMTAGGEDSSDIVTSPGKTLVLNDGKLK